MPKLKTIPLSNRIFRGAICSYTKQDLADLYFPNAKKPKDALNELTRLIKSRPALVEGLRDCCHFDIAQKLYNSEQVALIFQYCDWPGERREDYFFNEWLMKFIEEDRILDIIPYLKYFDDHSENILDFPDSRGDTGARFFSISISELARYYFPLESANSARTKFQLMWRKPELYQQLVSQGYKQGNKMFSTIQVRTIVSYYGPPRLWCIRPEVLALRQIMEQAYKIVLEKPAVPYPNWKQVIEFYDENPTSGRDWIRFVIKEKGWEDYLVDLYVQVIKASLGDPMAQNQVHWMKERRRAILNLDRAAEIDSSDAKAKQFLRDYFTVPILLG